MVHPLSKEKKKNEEVVFCSDPFVFEKFLLNYLL